MLPLCHWARMLHASLAETMSMHSSSCRMVRISPALMLAELPSAEVAGGFKGAGGGGDGLIQQRLISADLFQNQQRRHHLGEAGGIELLVLILGVCGLAGVEIQQQRGLGANLRIRRGCGPGRGKEPHQAGGD